MNNIHPAQLWIGSQQALEAEVISFLQKILCPNGGCTTCTTCLSIAMKQHHQFMWLEPEKNYSLATLEPIFEKIAFTNENGKAFFFILQKADTLTTTCANSLLKSVEEPPAGYHFIFLAERLHTILPTIRSRCTTEIFKQTESAYSEYSELIQTFKQNVDPLTFLQILEKNVPNDRETINLVDNLLAYWTKEHLKNLSPEILKKISLLHDAVERPPMPGSSKIFWKNLFIQFSTIR
jgi:DNA polymerase-3 subunit delta'